MRARWDALVQAVAEDEAHSRRVVLFPPCITPEVFRRHWSGYAGAAIETLAGVLGGESRWTCGQARSFLDLSLSGAVLLIQGGDTPAWDPLLRATIPYLAPIWFELPGRTCWSGPASTWSSTSHAG